MTNQNSPILVTGSHRSGSTWAGKMIAKAAEVGYIHEPFNLFHRPGLCSAQFDYWYTYICDENESAYIDGLKDCLQFKYNLWRDFSAFKPSKDLYYTFRDYYRFNKYKLFKKRPLVKDPLALFSVEWLSKRFNMDVVVMIRHPAAFAGSLKKIKWIHPLDHFLKQPLLMKSCLMDFKETIESHYHNGSDIIDHAILLWNIIHHMILKFKKSYSEWIFIRHEDLSRHPVEEFQKIFHKLDLKFSDYVENKILDSSFSKKKEIHKRDSRSNIWSWKNRLTEDEIEKIKVGTYAISRHFYSEKDWL
jgi:hypothetical protein